MSENISSCSGLTILDVSNFNTSSVSNMGSMFSGCWRLTSLNISGFETSKVTNMSYLFSKCSALTSLDVGNFNTSNVINMSYMFSSCSGLTSLNVSHFDTSKVTDMSSMFSECSSLTSLDLSSFEMFNVAKTRFMFDSCSNLTTAITISNPSTTDYNKMFNNAATNGSAKITVNYMESTSNLVDQMIATKSTGSNVVKGTKILGYNVTINGNNDIIPNVNQALPNQSVILSSASGNYMVTSFKMNESLVKGNSFIMPNTDVSITDIVVMKITIIESPHNPYPNSLNNKVYGEKTFEGATSLTVVLDYQTEGTFYDYIYLYDSSGTQYGKYGGYSRKTETIIIPGNYIKVVFSTDSSGNSYYGFKASIIPNYD